MKIIFLLVVLTTFSTIKYVESQNTPYCTFFCSSPFMRLLNPICGLCPNNSNFNLNSNTNTNTGQLSERVSSGGAPISASGNINIGSTGAPAPGAANSPTTPASGAQTPTQTTPPS